MCFFFILRQDAGDDLWNMQALADGFGCALVVASEHDDVDAHFWQSRQWLRHWSLFSTSATAMMPMISLSSAKRSGVLPSSARAFEAGRDGFGVDMGLRP